MGRREVSTSQVRSILETVDVDNSGAIEPPEFVAAFRLFGGWSTKKRNKNKNKNAGTIKRQWDGRVVVSPPEPSMRLFPASSKQKKKPEKQTFTQRRSMSPSKRRGARLDVLLSGTKHRVAIDLCRRKLRAAAYTSHGVDYDRLFRHYDRDSGGTLGLKEFISLMRRDAKVAKRAMLDAELKVIFERSVDTSGDGEVSCEEFVAWLKDDEARRRAELWRPTR